MAGRQPRKQVFINKEGKRGRKGRREKGRRERRSRASLSMETQLKNWAEETAMAARET